MGYVKDMYLKYKSAGDKYVVQCTTGKYQISKSFTLSPAYFDISHIDDPEQRL